MTYSKIITSYFTLTYAFSYSELPTQPDFPRFYIFTIFCLLLIAVIRYHSFSHIFEPWLLLIVACYHHYHSLLITFSLIFAGCCSSLIAIAHFHSLLLGASRCLSRYHSLLLTLYHSQPISSHSFSLVLLTITAITLKHSCLAHFY